jgi:PQQ-dependent dehydrogenase (s-GDH family)
MKKILFSLLSLCAIVNIHAQCVGTGSINFQRWNNITGTSVSNLTASPNYPNNPSSSGTRTLFEMPSNISSNFGIKMYGYICPPTTGSYVFWIASDDNAELWLSTSSNPAQKVKIAFHTGFTNSREWTKYATQKSASIALVSGQKYYVEALMKEGSGGDNLAVGWAKPGQSTATASEVIPGAQLSVNSQTGDIQAPTAPTNLSATNVTSTTCTLSWTASTDNVGVVGYDIYKSGVKINTNTMIGTSYSVNGLSPNSTASITVRAKDAAGNSTSSVALSVTTIAVTPASETFAMRTIVANQRMPHDLVVATDGNIWYTERFGGTVSFVNPTTNVKTIVLTLGSLMARTGGQDGLMGLALHPQFGTGKPYVYIAYTYESTSLTLRKTRIQRYDYDAGAQTLINPVTILENIPGSNDHNSARLAIGPDLKLYFSVGDMGAGQFDNATRPNNAQSINIYEGKILRLNTEAISSSWIPTDNPFTNAGQPTAVYSLGHRNPQGLVWGNVNGANILYSTEHGPFSDDEVNVINAGTNYGWPNTVGFCDGNYNGITVGGFAIVNEQTNCNTLNVKQPLRTLFPSENPPTSGDNNLWPSVAPSGTEFYGSTAIPGWQNSLLIAALKAGVIVRYKLSADGQSIVSDTINYFRGKGRFRDVAVSADGLKLYVACDSSGSTSGPTGGVTTTPPNPGSILEFSYVAPPLRANITKLGVDNRDISIYPNPANDFVIINNFQAIPFQTIELVDMTGRVMLSQKTNSQLTKIDISQFSNGMYMLRFVDAKGTLLKTEKLIVQQ